MISVRTQNSNPSQPMPKRTGSGMAAIAKQTAAAINKIWSMPIQ